MGLRYANIMKGLFFTAFLVFINFNQSPMFPIGTIMTFIGIIIVYWVDKYLIITRFVCDNKLSYKLPKSIMKKMINYSRIFSFSNLIMLVYPIY